MDKYTTPCYNVCSSGYVAERERPDRRANVHRVGLSETWEFPLSPFYRIYGERATLMPREFIAPNGNIYFRTKLLRPEQADRFASCLAANASRFTDVESVLSQQAKGERCCFVQYRPVNLDRQWKQVERQQKQRTRKAQTEGCCYDWLLDTDGTRPFYGCHSTSGEVYEVTSGECSCPDFQFRLKKVAHFGLRCKHIEALSLCYQTGELVRLQEVLAARAPKRGDTWAVYSGDGAEARK